ncbi:MAG TPA: NAD(P)-binding protein [Negativicutes bacterium]|jgi:protoporphyrinogen oxidase
MSDSQVIQHVIIGAGPTGLSAAYHLGEGSLLLEQHETLGGCCRSLKDKGFVFDYAGHVMFSNDPYVHRMYKLLLSDNVHWQDRDAWIFSKNTYTRYPFQGSLYGLPPQVIKECILGAIDARFSKIPDNKACLSASETADYRLAMQNPGEYPQNLEQFIYKEWGVGIARHFAIPYNRKLWGLPLNEIETSWLSGRVPLPDLEEMVDGALKPVPKPMGLNARFGYPLQGGIQSLMNGFQPYIKGQVKLGAKVVAVLPHCRQVNLKDGTYYRYQTLISTMPLPVLIALMGDQAPSDIRRAARSLRHISIRNVNLGIGRPNLTGKHWVYLPEDQVFHRIFVQGNASPYCSPAGGFGLTCEISYSELKPLPCEGEALIKRCIEDCVKIGMIKPGERLITVNQVDMPYAYVIYDHNRAKNMGMIRSWLEAKKIITAGRYGEWEYYNSDHALIAGKTAAEKARLLNTASSGLLSASDAQNYQKRQPAG